MSRIKRGIISRSKHKKLLKEVKGYRGTKSKLIRVAREAYLHAGQYAYHGRKLKKRDFRRSWILRISEAVKKENYSYNKFISALKHLKIDLNRKILSDLILKDPETFLQIVVKTKEFNFTPTK